MNKKVIIILAAVVGVLVLTCVGGIVAFGVWANQPPPEGITVQVELPDAIYEGDTFDFVVTVRNDQAVERTLYDIDFWPPLADGITLGTISPQPQTVDEIIMLTCTFNTTIPAQGEIAITFSATADSPGVFEGSLDVSVDHMMAVLSTPQTITIYNAADKP